MKQTKNHLQDQSSPYLLQHVDNPVHWYPWCEKALQRAKKENKPILLSIGYSACHWCHVMAHESFEDETTAKIMNELFINIKVDREERPDLDKIYQTAQYVLNQRPGGWPLTMFLTPGDQMPFFGGTYFPDTPRHGLPAFKQLLHHIADFYQNRCAEIITQNQSMQRTLQTIYTPGVPEADLPAHILDTCTEYLEKIFDPEYGGFGDEPKFPRPGNMERLLRYYAAAKINNEDRPRVRHAALHSLEKMAAGGIFDHLGGGFYRYSVDQRWMIPHFEKMLYDNGALLALYAQACSLHGFAPFKTACDMTAGWLMREMQSPEGGYYSALDADSEGVEGKFYLWDRSEVQSLLSADEYELFASRFGLNGAPNFEGSYHLHVVETAEQTSQTLSTRKTECTRLLEAAKTKLLTHREKRIRPARDEKILTSWNALTIRGMAIASRVLNNASYLNSAERARDFIRNTLWKNQRLFASCKASGDANKVHLAAYLDDYAYLLDALLEMSQTQWNSNDITWAQEIADVMLEQFEDPEMGGFYFTAKDHEQLIQRPRVFGDDATPSGNGIAAFALARLGYLLVQPSYIQAAERTLQSAAQSMSQSPAEHASLLHAFEEQLQPPQIIILRGKKEPLTAWQKACHRGYSPQRMVFAIDENVTGLPDAIAKKTFNASSPQGVTAYICKGVHCDTPVESLTTLQQLLSNTGVQASDC